MPKTQKFIIKYWYVILSIVTVIIYVVNLQSQTIENKTDIQEIKNIIQIDLRHSIENLQRVNMDLTKTVYLLEGCINGKENR